MSGCSCPYPTQGRPPKSHVLLVEADDGNPKGKKSKREDKPGNEGYPCDGPYGTSHGVVSA